jgi:hypothetical protein
MNQFAQYINGRLEASIPIQRLRRANANPLTIGWSAIWQDRYFAGLINHVAYWNVALTASQITDLMTHGPRSAAIGLLGFWPFDDGQGTVAYDRSPYKNHGTLTGSSAATAPQWVTIQRSEKARLH